jgi:small subunit ribosomal protein S9
MAETKTNSYFYALGRRKSATARVRLMSGKGKITINGKTAADYFQKSEAIAYDLNLPFKSVDSEGKFDITVVVSGGGTTSQAGAIRLALSKALVVLNPDLKTTLKKADLLGRDQRMKERKKFGLKGARKQRQFTKR